MLLQVHSAAVVRQAIWLVSFSIDDRRQLQNDVASSNTSGSAEQLAEQLARCELAELWRGEGVKLLLFDPPGDPARPISVEFLMLPLHPT
jgi:hypothetical protein